MPADGTRAWATLGQAAAYQYLVRWGVGRKAQWRVRKLSAEAAKERQHFTGVRRRSRSSRSTNPRASSCDVWLRSDNLASRHLAFNIQLYSCRRCCDTTQSRNRTLLSPFYVLWGPQELSVMHSAVIPGTILLALLLGGPAVAQDAKQAPQTEGGKALADPDQQRQADEAMNTSPAKQEKPSPAATRQAAMGRYSRMANLSQANRQITVGRTLRANRRSRHHRDCIGHVCHSVAPRE